MTIMTITRKHERLALSILVVILLIIIIFLLLRPRAAPRAGASYYISPSGGGSTCSMAAPCSNLATGVGKLASGDTLYVRAGTYSSSNDYAYCGVNVCIPAGASGAPTIIKAYPGETATLAPTGSISRLIDFEATENFITIGASDGTLILDGTNVQQGCIQMNHSDNHDIIVQYLEIKNCGTASGSGPHGVNSADGTTFLTVSHNRIHDIDLTAGNDLNHGIYLHGDSHTISYNTIWNVPGACVQLYGPSVDNSQVFGNICHDAGKYMNYSAGFIISSGMNHKVFNNILYNNPVGIEIFDGCSGCLVYNNTVYGSTRTDTSHGGGILVYASTSGTVFTNNLLYMNSAHNYINLGSPTPTCTTNVGLTSGCATNDSPANPNFNNTTGDTGFRLTATSPSSVIAAGTNLFSAGVMTDVDGVDARPMSGAFDIGADQYVAGGGGGTLTLLRALTRPPVIGNGSPSGAVYCNTGDLFIQLDGSATHKLWICTNAATLAWEQQ